MLISKEKLLKEAARTGFRSEILEKVILLIDLLNAIASDPYLGKKLALKGGTALNLFYFDLPRLSVDIDLNYYGSINKEEMQKDRIKIESILFDIFNQKGFRVHRAPKVHAGGKITLRYPSAFGQQGNLEVDLNFMYRIPLWPIVLKDGAAIGSYQAKQVPTLDFHEIAAGKLSALLDRQTGRDLFDTYHLLKKTSFDIQKLRLAFVVYGAMSSKKDFRKISINDITFDSKEFNNKLIPMLSRNRLNTIESTRLWAQQLVEECQAAFEQLLPLNSNEIEFLNLFLEKGELLPNLLTQDEMLIANIHSHPGLKWKILKAGLNSKEEMVKN